MQAKLAVAAITLAGSAMLATPVMPDARTEIVIGPYQLILSRRAPQFALAERCLVGDCALVEIVIHPANGPVWRIEL